MSILNRIANLAKASLHEVLDKLENPVMMTGQYLRDLENDIQKAEEMLKEQRMAVNINERKSAEALQTAKHNEAKALTALEAGDELTARQAAAAKIQYEEEANKYAQAAKEAQGRVVELQLRLKEGKEEYAKLKEKRNELAERAKKVEANAPFERNNSFKPTNLGGAAARGFERMEEKILEWEARSQVNGSNYSSAPGGPSATTDPAVQEELERLKDQLSSRNQV